jgi:hypothetical protein
MTEDNSTQKTKIQTLKTNITNIFVSNKNSLRSQQFEKTEQGCKPVSQQDHKYFGTPITHWIKSKQHD